MGLALLAATTACGKKPPIVQPQIVTVVEAVDVAVPVPVKATLPPELLAPLPPLPLFVAPNDPRATVALTAEGVEAILKWVRDVRARWLALKAYDEAP